jgi:xanthine dehydrogenase YagT iron-sulfur-binding subunit
VDDQISRRNFLRGVGVSAVAGTVAKVRAVAQSVESLDDQKPVGPQPVKLVLQINGHSQTVEIEPRATLLDVLRNRLQLTGTKEVCDRATCGACTVLVDGQPTYACMKLAIEMDGRQVTTIEGIGSPDSLTSIQRSFIECDALMCGYCTPGFIMSLTALFRSNPNPTSAEIRKACTGNLCRCGSYLHIFQAAEKAKAASKQGLEGGRGAQEVQGVRDDSGTNVAAQGAERSGKARPNAERRTMLASNNQSGSSDTTH